MPVKKIPRTIKVKIEKMNIYGNGSCDTAVVEIRIKSGEKLTPKQCKKLEYIFKAATSAKKSFIMPYYGDDKNSCFLNLADLNLDKLNKFLLKI
jgi:hypothetical protein